ncbi:MAG: hypothetical protein ACOY3X_09765 [Pseudomonadota bacterium]
MEFVLADLFGSLGGLLTLFIVLFCIAAIPAGIYFAMKNAVQLSAEQDRINAEKHRRQAP